MAPLVLAAGAVQVNEVAEATLTEAQVSAPTFAVAPLTNPVPVIVRGVAESLEPEVGVTPVIVRGITV